MRAYFLFFSGLVAHFQDFANLNTPLSTANSNTGFPANDIFPPDSAFPTDSPFPSAFTTAMPFPAFPTDPHLPVDPFFTTPSVESLDGSFGVQVSTAVPAMVPTEKVIVPETNTALKTNTAGEKIKEKSLNSARSTSDSNQSPDISLINENFLPNIPAGGIFTNLISGISGSFNPSSNWLFGEDKPGITAQQGNTKQNIPQKEPVSNLPKNVPVVPVETPNQIVIQKNPAVPKESPAQEIKERKFVAAKESPNQKVLQKIPENEIVTVKIPTTTKLTGLFGKQNNQEPGGVAVGVGGLPVNSLDKPVLAPLPGMARVDERVATAGQSPEQMIRRVENQELGNYLIVSF